MAAALRARECGVERIVIFERAECLGGILEQCIHTGFGLHYFKEELSGPEYAQRFIDEVEQSEIDVLTDTMVIDLSTNNVVTAISRSEGLIEVDATAVILAMGCRERPRGALNIAGTRPAGVMTAGTAQRYVNIDGHLPRARSGYFRLWRYRPDYGAAHDAGGRACKNGVRIAALFERAEAQYCAVPGGF